ncbi:hypothetical protein ACQFX9_14405 [Aliinostoc sp. HNIBRCY26]|uniref:hypothetical protein n=1 Tax=Aliinostoc sp. HNIBRCY26 TaxID=3418997 RepID=UPI003CFE5D5E
MLKTIIRTLSNIEDAISKKVDEVLIKDVKGEGLVLFTVEDLVDTILDIQADQRFIISELLKIQEKLEDLEERLNLNK